MLNITNKDKAYMICMLLHPTTIMSISAFLKYKTEDERWDEYITYAKAIVDGEIPPIVPKHFTEEEYIGKLKKIVS